MKLRYKRFAAITMVLIFFFSLTAPAFAEGISAEQSTVGSDAGFYEETGALLDSAQMAGEAIVCVSDNGAILLQVRLADTDIVLTNMMDVTEGVENLSAAKRKRIFGTGVVPEGCRIMAAQSQTMDTESLIALLESCDGVYFAEANTITALSDIMPEESAEDLAEDELSELPAAEETLPQDTAEQSGETVQEQTEETAAELSANEDTDAPVQNISINIPETDGTSKSDMTVMQWALENLGKVLNGKAGVDVNLLGTTTKNQTVICVMDTGIDYLHEDLDDRMVNLSKACYTNGEGKQIMTATGCGQYGYNTVNAADHTDPMDYYNHGTHCAGIIAGEGNRVSEGETPGTSGVMDKADLLAVKLSDGQTVGNLNILDGLQWVLQAKTEFGVNIAACNYSLGGTWACSAIQLAIAQLDAADITFCISSGNESTNIDYNEYSTYEGADSALVVDALKAEGTAASFSNYGMKTDVFAPGSMIYSTVNEYTGITETGEYVNADPIFDGAAYGEAEQTLAYAGFDGNGKDTLTFFEVTSGTKSHAAVTTAYYKSGGQSLQLDGTDGSVVLESNEVNLTQKGYREGEPLYFDMGAVYSDLKNAESTKCYTQIAFKVKYKSGINAGHSGYAVYAVQYAVNDTDYPWYGVLKSGDDFEKYRVSLGEEEQADAAKVINQCSEALTLSEWIKQHAEEWEIDYAHFQIRLETGSTKNMDAKGTIDTKKAFTTPINLDAIAVGSQAGYYDYMGGTSMAAPAVTGIYGLIYSHYGKECAKDTQYECNDKISARIAGSVTTTDKDGASLGLDQYCITGGVVNASAALSMDESDFNPVIQSASVSGDVLTLKGWFLGKEGSITIGGKTAKILSWDQDKNEAIDDADNAGSITVQIPEDITGEQIIKVTNAKGKTGRFYTDCSRITTDYIDLTLPENYYNDLEMRFLPTSEQKFAVIDQSAYLYGVTDDCKQTLDIYNTETESWQSVPFVNSTAPANSIYGFVSSGTQLYGLFATFKEDGITLAGEALYRLDIQDGQAAWTRVLSIENRIYSAMAVSEDKLYIIGGCNLNKQGINTADRVIFAEDGSGSLERAMDLGDTEISNNCKMAVKGDSIYALYCGSIQSENGFFKIDLKAKTVDALSLPSFEAAFYSADLSSTPSGLILNANFKTGEKPADTWFFNTATETWQASDLVLDSALSHVISSVSAGNKVYVLGKSRNGSFWFFRALSFEETGMSADWHKGSGKDAVLNIPVSRKNLTEEAVTLDGKALTEGKDCEILPAAKDTENNLDAEVLNAGDSGEAEQTTVVLKNAFLETLDLGRHDVVLAYNISGRDLTVTCTLNVLEAEKTNVSTGISGSDSGMTTAIALILLAAALGSVLFLRRKRD